MLLLLLLLFVRSITIYVSIVAFKYIKQYFRYLFSDRANW